MTQEQIEYIEKNLKWPINIGYITSFLFVFLPLLFVYYGMKEIITGETFGFSLMRQFIFQQSINKSPN